MDVAAHEASLPEWIFGARKQRRGEKPMTMLAILGIAVGAVLIVAAIVYTRRSRKNQEPLALGVGRKLRP
jgi:LPXTG-motif cell wall-anchored protein